MKFKGEYIETKYLVLWLIFVVAAFLMSSVTGWLVIEILLLMLGRE